MSTITLGADKLRDYLGALGYQHDATPGVCNIVGVRGAEPANTPEACQLVTNRPNAYNDTIVLFGQRVNGQDYCECFRGTVDPGRTWTLNPTNHKGCAHLVNGQYRYQFGIHKGHQALTQAAKVKVWRDQNKNYIKDGKDGVETGWFGINIHAGGKAPQVNSWSAGCQVLHGGWAGKQWTTFMRELKAGPKDQFWYSLVDAPHLAAWSKHGAGNITPDAPELDAERRAALQEVLGGIATLYDYQEKAALGEEGGVTFSQLLNRLRNTGLLKSIKLAARPHAPAVPDESAARDKLLGGFRRIYSQMIDAGLDQTFHAQLNQLRQFGPLSAS